jgi:hypothetical protein
MESLPEVGAEVLEPGVAGEAGDDAAAQGSFEELARGRDVCAGGEAAEDPLALGDGAGGGDGLVVGDGQVAVADRAVEEQLNDFM